MITTRFFSRAAVIGAALTALSPLALAAQTGRIVLTPYGGVYAPLNDLARAKAGEGGFAAAIAAKHKASFAYGANASYWLSERAAVEVGMAYSASDLGTVGNISGEQTSVVESSRENAHVLMGSAKLMFHLLPAENGFNIRLGLGPAIISRGGSAYKAEDMKVSGLTDVGAAMSLCTRIPIVSNFGLRLRAENYMYQAKMKLVDKIDPANSFTFDQRLQNDFLFSAGFQFTVNR